jgi:hypothetical protein
MGMLVLAAPSWSATPRQARGNTLNRIPFSSPAIVRRNGRKKESSHSDAPLQ